MALTVLVVNDDPTQRRLLEAAVNSHGYDVETVKSSEAAIAFMQSEKAKNLDLILLESAMSGQDSFEVLQKIKSSWPDVPTIVLTDQSGIENIVKVMRAGAADFIPKPTNPERLLVSMKNALKMNKLSGQGSQFSRQFEGRSQSDDLIADGCMLVLTAARKIRTLETMEADMIRTAIQKYQGRMTEIARRLGIGRSTLYRKVNKFGLLTCGYPI